MAEKIDKKIANEFAEMIRKKTGSIVGGWDNGIQCYYDDGEWAIRQFVYHVDHSWGTAYCYWTVNTKYDLINFLQEVGATNIKAKVKWIRGYKP